MTFLKPLSHSILLPVIEPIAPAGAPVVSLEYTSSSEIVVSSPAEYAGTYSVTKSDVANGPTTIVAPRVVGSAVVGQTLSLEPGLYAHGSTEGSPVAFIQWMRGGSPIPGESGSTHIVTTTDLSDGLAVRVTVTNPDGAISDTINVATATVAQPTLVSSLPNVTFVFDTGDQTIDASLAFTGGALTYSVDGGGASIDPVTGSITHGTADLLAQTQIIVSATNSVGTAQTIYVVEVVPAEPQIVSTIDDQSWTEGQGVQDIDASAAFSGTHLTYSVSGDGVSVDASSGVVSHSTSVVGMTNEITVTATNASGSASTSYNAAVKRAAPVVVDTLPDRNYSVSSGTHTFDASVAFIGTNLTYSVQGPGASIDGSTGILVQRTDSAITGTITVSAANEAGSVDANYQLTITEDGYDVIDSIPDITVALTDNGNGTHNATITGSDSDYTSHSPVVVQDPDLAAGIPINLVPAIVTESPADTFNVKAGLWISPTNDQAVFSGGWFLGGEDTGDTDNSYTDAGTLRVEYREVAVNTADTVEVIVEARAGVSAWEPTDLGSKVFLWLDFTDASTMYTDAARTTLVSSFGDDVKGMTDKSGKGHDASVPTATAVGTYENGHVDFSGAHNAILVVEDDMHGNGWKANGNALLAVFDFGPGPSAALGSGQAGTLYLGAMTDGSAIAPHNIDSPDYYIDGTEIVSATRDSLHDNMTPGSFNYVEARNFGFSSEADEWVPLGYYNGGYGTFGNVRQYVLVDNDLMTAQDWADLRQWAAEQAA